MVELRFEPKQFNFPAHVLGLWLPKWALLWSRQTCISWSSSLEWPWVVPVWRILSTRYLLSFPTIHFGKEQPNLFGPGSVVQSEAVGWFKLSLVLLQRGKRKNKMRPKFISIFKVIFKKHDGGRQHMSVSWKDEPLSPVHDFLWLWSSAPCRSLCAACSGRSVSPRAPVEGEEDKIGTGCQKDPPSFVLSECSLFLRILSFV